MNLQSLTLKNFKSYGPKPQTIDLRNITVVGVGGANGSGKSTLIDALTFALFGKASTTETRELGTDALINDRANEAYVSAAFEKDGITHLVQRAIRRRGTGKAQLTYNGLSQPIVEVNTVNMKTQSILGMDYETFVSSTIIRQDEMDRLTARRPAERKEVLANIFGLQLYEVLRKKAHEKFWKIKNEVAGLESTKDSLMEKVSKEESVKKLLLEKKSMIADLRLQQNEVEEEKKKLRKKLEEIREKKREFDVKKAEVNSLQIQIKDYEENLEKAFGQLRFGEEAEKSFQNIRQSLEARDKFSQDLESLLQQRESLKIEVAEHRREVNTVEHKIGEETGNLQKIEGQSIVECPFCKRPLNENHRKKLLKEFKLKLNDLAVSREENLSKARKAEELINMKVTPSINDLQEKLAKFSSLDRKFGETHALIKNLPQLKAEAKKLEDTIEARRKMISATKKDLQTLSSMIQTFDILDRKMNELEERLLKVHQKLAAEEANFNHVKKDFEEMGEAKERLGKIKDQLEEKLKVSSAYEFLEKRVFHKDGVPTSILTDIVPDIELESSRILRQLSNGGMDISFRLGRKTRTGKITDELIVEAVVQGRNHPVSRYSGGERMRINLALRLGLSEVITKRTGYKGNIETLIVDEGFGSLDEEGRKAAVEILQSLRQRFKKIIVISHIEEIREAFETKITVKKPAGGYSVVTV